MNPLEMTGQTVVVTGASSGLGREASVLLSQLGARVVLVGRNQERLNATLDLMTGSGHRVECFDLCQLGGVGGWLKDISASVGPFSGLVHCAGVQMIRLLRALTPEDVDSVMRINFAAALALSAGFRQRGVCAPQGSLVFVASVMGLVGSPARSVYSASKGALIAMTKSLALELAHEGIRVNCVAPGFVRSSMFEELTGTVPPDQIAAIEAAHPLGLGQPRDVAHAIAFLLAQTSRWITGTTLVVDGGYTAQ
jgi:NAD(P)-dependent dehydrogenase (short-subunit alcohol dehydrogenase family)